MAKAVFEGKVQGVVVHAKKNTASFSSSKSQREASSHTTLNCAVMVVSLIIL